MLLVPFLRASFIQKYLTSARFLGCFLHVFALKQARYSNRASCFIERLVHDCSARDVRDHIQHASKKEGVSVDQYCGMCKGVLDSLSIYIYIYVYIYDIS